MNKRVTMADVAREAGVSLQTVSRAINNKDEISEQTKKRVLEAVGRLGFRPNGIARSLATNRTTTVGLVVTDIANPFFSGIARGVEDVAYASGYSIFLCSTDEDSNREKAALDSLLNKQVDGLILCSSRLENSELSRRIKEFSFVVLINREPLQQPEHVGSITVDYAFGAQTAVTHLIAIGRKKIGLLAGPQVSWSGQRRLGGYKVGMQEHGLAIDPEWIQYCEPDIECGKRVTRTLFKVRSDLTAIVAYNDLVAVGALQACQELGRNVPGDVAIIGFDDIPLTSLVTPSLSTLHIPVQEIGKAAMWMLIGIIGGDTSLDRKLSFKPELVVRTSTRQVG